MWSFSWSNMHRTEVISVHNGSRSLHKGSCHTCSCSCLAPIYQWREKSISKGRLALFYEQARHRRYRMQVMFIHIKNKFVSTIQLHWINHALNKLLCQQSNILNSRPPYLIVKDEIKIWSNNIKQLTREGSEFLQIGQRYWSGSKATSTDASHSTWIPLCDGEEENNKPGMQLISVHNCAKKKKLINIRKGKEICT